MASHRFWILALVAWCLLATVGRAEGPPNLNDARQLAERIDQMIEARLAKAGIQHAPLASDSTLLRRLSLDILGRIPAVSESRKYLGDPGSEKFERAVERMLESPGYISHFTQIWRELLLPEAGQDMEKYYLVPGIENWLRKQMRENTPYDKMVREIITLPMDRTEGRRPGYYGRGDNSPMAFYQAKDGKPEEIAASAVRVFLGIRLECAQCHDHPFAKWSREQFWSQASFFAGVRTGRNGIYGPVTEVTDRREMAIPNTERIAQAQFLDGTEPRWKFKVSARESFADWMTAPENPYFARTAVNRLWAHFFGIGLVDPVDNFDPENPASHPEVLDELARAFIKSGYDNKFIIRAITLSRTYRRASTIDSGDQPDPRLFSHMAVRGLTPEQLFNSLVVATGYRDPFNRQQRFYNPNSPRGMFLSKFQNSQDKPIEHRTSISQALAMMNNTLIMDLTDSDKGQALAAILSSPFLDTPGKIESLYLAVLSRKPQPEELDKLTKLVIKGGATGKPKQALADLYWALLNSPEFLLNH